MKEEFIEFTNKSNTEGSGKASAYIRAIELLDDILNRKNKVRLNGFSSIYDIQSTQIIEEIRKFILIEQKRENGIFEGEEPSSYWRNYFYSAAINEYLNFLSKKGMKQSKKLTEFSSKSLKNEIISTKSIREFAFEVFRFFYQEKWENLLTHLTQE